MSQRRSAGHGDGGRRNAGHGDGGRKGGFFLVCLMVR